MVTIKDKMVHSAKAKARVVYLLPEMDLSFFMIRNVAYFCGFKSPIHFALK